MCSAALIGFLFDINTLDRTTYDADPSKWDPKIKYQYSNKSSTTTLRPHIEKYHLELYLQLQKQRGWKILLPGLVSQARSQATSTANSLQEVARDRFDEPTFHGRLVEFIVTDDQVCVSQFWFGSPLLTFFQVAERH